MESLYRWSKLIDPDDELHWETRLITDQVVHSFESVVNRKKTKVSSYCTDRSEADKLRARYGGGVAEIRPEDWEPTTGPSQSPLIRIRDRLIVTESTDQDDISRIVSENPGRTVLSFPPQLAFGTGSHPTTAGCLRFLTDEAGRLPDSWKCLDLGCGSAILSVASAKLGSARTVAIENDTRAIEVARENAALHQVSQDIEFIETDAIEWLQSAPRETFDIIAANLFSTLLVQILPLLDSWLADGGKLILSGFLTTQTKSINEAALAQGFELTQFSRKGKWVAALGSRP